MATALDLITAAARLIGVVFKSESLSADEAADGLDALNDMLASWANNDILVNARTDESFTITAASVYTIGTGQTLNTVRPISIIQAYIRLSGTDYPLDLVSDQEYGVISQKSVVTSIPRVLNYTPEYPAGEIRIWPQASGQLFLLSEKPLANIASISTTVDLPPGWSRAIKYNLAIDLAAQYGANVPDSVAKVARDSLSNLCIGIAKNRPIKFTPRFAPEGNIFAGWRS